MLVPDSDAAGTRFVPMTSAHTSAPADPCAGVSRGFHLDYAHALHRFPAPCVKETWVDPRGNRLTVTASTDYDAVFDDYDDEDDDCPTADVECVGDDTPAWVARVLRALGIAESA